MGLSTVLLHDRGNFFSRVLPIADMFPYYLSHTLFMFMYLVEIDLQSVECNFSLFKLRFPHLVHLMTL
jgi:hypothetical protein